MTKKELRKVYLNKRSALSLEEVDRFSSEIAVQILKEIDLAKVRNAHIFLSSTKHIEVDTFLVMKLIQDQFPELQFVVPKSDYSTHSFQNLKFKIGDELVYDTFGIPEPKEISEVDLVKIDLVFLPLICCDLNGQRVGYGKGFYDRFLEKLDEKIPKIGLSFFEPYDIIQDVGEFDRPLTACITPKKVFSFKN